MRRINAGALRVRLVEVAYWRDAKLRATLHEDLAKRVRPSGDVADRDRSAGAVACRCAPFVIFHAPKIRQHIRPVPARIAASGPVVEITCIAPNIDHRVDRARAAEHLATRPVRRTTVKTRVRFGRVPPVHAGIRETSPVTDRYADPRAAIGPTGLENQHTIAAARRQPVRKHTAGGTGTDDHIVEFVVLQRLPPEPRLRSSQYSGRTCRAAAPSAYTPRRKPLRFLPRQHHDDPNRPSRNLRR